MFRQVFIQSLNALLVIKIFKLLSWLFGHVEKRVDWKGKVNFKIYDVTTWFTKIAIHILISQEVKKMRQRNLVSLKNITWEAFFLKNHTVVEKPLPDLFLENQNWAYLWINSPKFYTVYFHCMASWGLSQYIEIKLQTTGFYLI